MVRIVSIDEIDYRDFVEPWDWYGEEESVKRSQRTETDVLSGSAMHEMPLPEDK